MNTLNTLLAPGETILTQTQGRCLTCGDMLPMDVVRTPGAVGLPDRVVGRRRCPSHGPHESLLASNARWYFVPPSDEKSCGAGCGCHAASGDAKATLGKNFALEGAFPDTLNTCIALFHIVEGCNLACPTCFADAPHVIGQGAVPLEEFRRRVDAAVAKKGDLEILMLSGGEPTIHPDLLEMLAWLKNHSGVQYVMLNTNGMKLARDPSLARSIGDIFARPKGGLQVYLQFDGPGEAGQVELRGADLRAMRLRAIENLSAAEVPVTLAMTVTPANVGTLWDTVLVSADNPWVHGVALQPEFSSGRAPHGAADRLTAACVIDGLIAQSGGTLTERSITPLPCGHPNCTFVGYVLRRADGTLAPVFDALPMDRLQGFLANSLHYTLDQLAQCGCDTTEMGALLHDIEGGASAAALGGDVRQMLAELKAGGRLIRIVVKPFMGVETFDARRVGMCCTHVLTPSGAMESFCSYYGGWGKKG
jgi:uncharacterized radical SAM superfamily Fe-S cluster-containing enzyme